jgi:hypothetical protein
MRKAASFFVIWLLVLLGACSKPGTGTQGKKYRGVVLTNVCAQVVVQSLGPDYVGQDTWSPHTDTTSPVYHHVFAVQNACQFSGNAGDTINFVIVATQPQNCIHCLIAVPLPDSALSIEVVR